MNIIELNVSGLKHQFKATLSSQDIVKKVEKKLVEIGKDLQLPGFRKGKVPVAVLRKRYAANVTSEAIDEVVEENVGKFLVEKKIRPALRPEISVEPFSEGQDLSLDVTVEALPEVPDISFDSYSFEQLVSDVDDKQIENAIHDLREIHKKAEDLKKPRAVQDEDLVFIDYKISADKKVIDSNDKTEGMPYKCGSNLLGKALDAAMIGQKVGFKGSSSVDLSDQYFRAHAGKSGTIDFEIKDIKQLVCPTEEELAKELNLNTPDDLRKKVKDELEKAYGHLSRQDLKRKILDTLADAVNFPVPEGMVEVEFQSIWQEWEEYEKSTVKDAKKERTEKEEQKLKDEYHEIAIRRVRLGLLLADLGMKNNIQVTREELSSALYDYVQQYPGRESQLLEYYRKNPVAAATFQAPIFEEKVSTFIISKVKVQEKKVPFEELKRTVEEEDHDAETCESESCSHADHAPKKTKKDAQKKATK